MEPIRDTEYSEDPLAANSILELDVYSSDGEAVGRVAGYMDEVAEYEAGMERGSAEVVPQGGIPLGQRRVLIDGHGFPTQGVIAVPENQLNVDLRGRRITLNLTIAQIREMPRQNPHVRNVAASSPS